MRRRIPGKERAHLGYAQRRGLLAVGGGLSSNPLQVSQSRALYGMVLQGIRVPDRPENLPTAPEYQMPSTFFTKASCPFRSVNLW